MSELRRVIEPVLPDGCPFVIGGGLVRDAIMGGRPSDIDVWLPSNINITDVDNFNAMLRSRVFGVQTSIMFTGPGAHDRPQNWANTDAGGSDYGDVNNHWVMEVSLSPTTPSINIMRSMTPWEGNSQPFFNGLMRAFDIDHCMFFIGYMPGEQSVNTVIMPQHMALALPGNHHPLRNEVGRFRLNRLYWNRYRLETTSQARIESRLEKMCNKYYYWNMARLPNMEGAIHLTTNQRRFENVGVIEVEEIIAVPVRLSEVMRCVNRHMNERFPVPTAANKVQRTIPEGLLESLIANRRA